MFKKSIVLLLILTSFITGYGLGIYKEKTKPGMTESFGDKEITTKEGLDLDRYSIEQLSKNSIDPGIIKIIRKIDTDDNNNFTSYYFEMEFRPDPASNKTKNVSGQLNIPKKESSDLFDKTPVIVMLRGYIDQETFVTGDGTRNASFYFANNGFITIAPDFLGYGGSDKEADNIFETRFQTYTTVLSLIKSLENISRVPSLVSGPDQVTELLGKNAPIFLWGHSNGGHIALTVLEVTGKDFPTVLWAPVTKAFPYSVLYYTDQSVDGGKLIRSELAKFEEINDVDKFSLTNYFDRLNTKIQFHQGNADDAIPLDWTNDTVNKLKGLDKDIEYYVYQGTDHNMRPSWDTVVERSLQFYQSLLL